MITRITEISLLEMERRAERLKTKEFAELTACEVLEASFHEKICFMFEHMRVACSPSADDEGMLASLIKSARIEFTEDDEHIYAELFDEEIQGGGWKKVNLKIEKTPRYIDDKKCWAVRGNIRSRP